MYHVIMYVSTESHLDIKLKCLNNNNKYLLYIMCTYQCLYIFILCADVPVPDTNAFNSNN